MSDRHALRILFWFLILAAAIAVGVNSCGDEKKEPVACPPGQTMQAGECR